MGKWLAGAVCAFFSLLAQAGTYSYVSPLYTTLAAFTAAPCAGNCATFTTAMRIQGIFTTAPLPPGLPAGTNITGSVTSYNFSDGLTAYVSTDPQARVYLFTAATDASGNISNFSMILLRWQQPGPWAAGSRLDRITAGLLPLSGVTVGAHNQGCTAGPAPSLNNGVADTCNSVVNDTHTSLAQRTTTQGTLLLLPTPPQIPALGEWGLVATVLLVAAAALFRARSRTAAAGRCRP